MGEICRMGVAIIKRVVMLHVLTGMRMSEEILMVGNKSGE